MSERFDVVVIGGGPGGLRTGALLAGAGRSVLLVEEHEEVGRPVHCTGVLAADAFEEFGLPAACRLNDLSTARFHAPSGHTISHTTHETEAVVIDRARLDGVLADRARDAGVEVRLGRRAMGVEACPGGVQVELQGGETVPARAAVLACGASFSLQRRLGLGMPTVGLNSAQLELPASRDGEVELYFGQRVAPGGFAWTVPVTRPAGHFVRVGLMCRGDAGAFFRSFVEQAAREWGIPPEAIGTPRRRYLPLSALPRTYAARLLAVGDAAGLVKPTTGGGIYYSLVSAGLAATTLDDALARDALDEQTLGAYQRGWRRRLGAELRAQLALRMVAQRLTDGEIDTLFDLASTDGVMPIIRRTARFNRHRGLIAALFKHPPARRVLFRRLLQSA